MLINQPAFKASSSVIGGSKWRQAPKVNKPHKWSQIPLQPNYHPGCCLVEQQKARGRNSVDESASFEWNSKLNPMKTKKPFPVIDFLTELTRIERLDVGWMRKELQQRVDWSHFSLFDVHSDDDIQWCRAHTVPLEITYCNHFNLFF